ncbi:hypothetical protein J0895_04815 [Phormidium pseudopriestleyi FRX01]|uniref:VWFA domain-containing protein n=1 Tax=Phormidium pseudopriestleyi FRX01 TaxID=1759528 RepID=A0ABS3FMW9_9CYAN|nr:hypothetical protein [Phormidium pseudopriestleyi]MBO0348436.1 hypothetical protein [Phormidium pseudopriestleyi FRX01]
MTISLAEIFDESYYLAQNPDVVEAVNQGGFSSAFQHYQILGASEERAPSYLFDPQYYAQQNPDVVAAVEQGEFRSLVQHFIEVGAIERRASTFLFSDSFYETRYPDVVTAVQQNQFSSTFDHFLKFGEQEGRWPMALFNPRVYLDRNADIAAAVEQGQYRSAFAHFAQLGIQENREFSQFVSLDYYRSTYATQLTQFYRTTSLEEVSFAQTFNHLQEIGLPQGLNPSPFVDVEYIRNNYSTQLTSFYQTVQVTEISFTQTFDYFTGVGLQQGLNPSPLIELTSYRSNYSTELTSFYGVQSINEVSFNQTYNYLTTIGLEQGFNPSPLVDLDYYRSTYGSQMAGFYGVESVESISFTQTYNYLSSVGLQQGFNPSEFIDLKFYRQTYAAEITSFYSVQSIEQVSFTQTFSHFSSQGLEQGLSPNPLIDLGYVRNRYASELVSFYSVQSIEQVSFTQTYTYITTEGIANGLNTSAFVDFEYYRNTYAAEITSFYGAQSITEVSATQIYSHLNAVGLQQGLQTSEFVDLDFYRRAYAAEITQFYGVNSIEQVGVADIYSFALGSGLEQGFSLSSTIDIQYFRNTYARELITFYDARTIQEISMGQTFEYITTVGIEQGLNTSEFVDVEYYRSTYAEELTSFYGVQSMTQVTYRQTFEHLINVGIQSGLNTSALVNIEEYRSRFSQQIIDFYKVESITQVTNEQIQIYIAIGGRNQSLSGEISGTAWNDLNENGIRDGEFVQGDEPDVIFVIDVSGSVNGRFRGSPVGDRNNNGFSDRIMDAQIAGFTALNQELINLGFGETANVGIVVFGTDATPVNMNPFIAGGQLTTNPSADENENGIRDIEEILGGLDVNAFGVGFWTNYQAALRESGQTLEWLNTTPEDANIIFLSDGVHNGLPFNQEIFNLRNQGVNLQAFGVGAGASLENLAAIDPGAQIFTSTDELLNVFTNLNPGNEGSGFEPGLRGVPIYLDLNNNGVSDPGEPITVTNGDGDYRFSGLPGGTYVVRELITPGKISTFPENASYLVEIGLGEQVEGLDFGGLLREGSTLSGSVWNDANGNGVRDPGLIVGVGNLIDVVLAVDVSESSLNIFEGAQVGDVNGDGRANTILDVQLASLIQLNQSIIDLGLGDSVNLAVVPFGDTSTILNMDRLLRDFLPTITARTDRNGNGISDVEEILRTLSFESYNLGSGTDFDSALLAADLVFGNSGTSPGNGTIILMTDGGDDSFDFLDRAEGLKQSEVNLRAFGVGPNASLATLQAIDDQAQVFTEADELLAYFSGTTTAATTTEPNLLVTEFGLVNVPVYLDLNENRIFDADEPIAFTNEFGEFSFTNVLPETYSVLPIVPPGFASTFAEFGYEITVGANQTLSGIDFGVLPVG